MKQKRGITLVALIITIIVLFILVGVVISMILGNDGIINKAHVVAGKYQNEKNNENNSLADYENIINSIQRGEKISKISNLISDFSIVTKEISVQNITIDLAEGTSKENIIGYIIFMGDDAIDVTNKMPYKISNLKGNTEYEDIYIIAIDKKGYIKNSSNKLTEKTISLISNGLVDYWKFKGSLINEISGKQDLVIDKGTPEFQEDGSVYLNNAVLKTNGNYSFPSKFTIEIQAKLVKAFPCRDNCNPIIGVGQTASGVGGTCVAVWWINNGAFCISNGLGDSYSRAESAGSSSSNTWYTLVLRYNGIKLELFKDGQKIIETDGTSLKDTPLYLGGLPTNHPSHFGESSIEGYFKNLCIYDRALSDEEIADL